MSDIILVSNLPTPSNRVVQALDNTGLQVVDLLTLDVFEIHRRTQLSVIDVQNLVRDVITALTGTIEEECTKTAEERNAELEFLTTGDETIDQLLGGGIPTGALTEVTGERLKYRYPEVTDKSGLGKSQLCLQLCIHVQLPRAFGGFEAGAIYIGTESSLATPRLHQIATSLSTEFINHPPPHISTQDIDSALDALSTHGDRILYFHCPDLESQEHTISYQLSVVLSRHRIGLIVLDSVTANYRAEFDRPTTSQKSQSQPAQMGQRSKDLRKLAGTLKDLAVEWNVAVVAVNQVTDMFKRSSSQGTQPQEEELLALDYQAKWFDGLVEEGGNMEGTKRPALGLVWSNLITSRVMLVRDRWGETRIRVVFSPFARAGSLVYEIGPAGIHVIVAGAANGVKDGNGQVLAVEQSDHCPEETDVSNTNLGSDFETKLDDIEFSDLDVEDLLSGKTNI